jgi:hypothetical protein
MKHLSNELVGEIKKPSIKGSEWEIDIDITKIKGTDSTRTENDLRKTKNKKPPPQST